MAASLVVHIGLLLALARISIPAVQPAVVAATPSKLVASLVSSNPQTTTATSLSLAPADNSAPPATAAASSALTGTTTPKLPAPLPTGIPDNSNRLHGTSQSAATSDEAAALQPESLQQSIDAYLSTYRTSLQSDWKQPCQLYRERLEHEDCEKTEETLSAQRAVTKEVTHEVFTTWAHSKARDERRATVLARKMDYLRPLMNDDTLQGRIASEIYSDTKVEYFFVKPKEPEGISLLGYDFGSGKLVLLSGLLTISFDGEITIDDERVYGPARSASHQEK